MRKITRREMGYWFQQYQYNNKYQIFYKIVKEHASEKFESINNIIHSRKLKLFSAKQPSLWNIAVIWAFRNKRQWNFNL